jgi:hypothetical protein
MKLLIMTLNRHIVILGSHYTLNRPQIITVHYADLHNLNLRDKVTN